MTAATGTSRLTSVLQSLLVIVAAAVPMIALNACPRRD
jgi:hypothetical protein